MEKLRVDPLQWKSSGLKITPSNGKAQTPPMEKLKPLQWKSSAPSNGKAQTPPMEKLKPLQWKSSG